MSEIISLPAYLFFKKKTLPLQCLFPVASGFKLSGLVFYGWRGMMR